MSRSHHANPAPASVELTAIVAGRVWRADSSRAADLSIPLRFDGLQPTFFGAARAAAAPIESGTFIGDVKRGGSVNCSTYSLTPHCNGTHTECLGHITREAVSVRSLAPRQLIPATLLSVSPESFDATAERSGSVSQQGDRLITRTGLQAASARSHSPIAGGAVIIRTMPNDTHKLTRNYDAGEMPPYLSTEAAQWLVESNVAHLIVDLPSIDRASDAGQLMAHRIFWGMPPGSTSASAASRAQSTITELAFAEDTLPDGLYLLNLQVAPFEADAAPSRPILYPLLST
jgi:kynurenine formamidase